MSLLKKYSIQEKSMEDLHDFPRQYIFTSVPKDSEVFQSKCNVANVCMIEERDKETGYKKQYLINPQLANQLDRKQYQIKTIHIVKTENGETRCIAIPLKTSNSWHISNLEILKKAQTSPIAAKRDHITKVYQAHIADIPQISITEENIEKAFENAFGQYEISDLNHPILAGKLKDGSIVDLVDNSKIKLLDNSDTAATNSPKLSDLEGVQHDQHSISRLKNEIELEDLFFDEDGFEEELDDDNGLEVEEISIDDIDIDEETT